MYAGLHLQSYKSLTQYRMFCFALNKRNVIEPQKGYSLIEMVVVIFIIVVLFGLGIANYRAYASRRAVHGVAEGIVVDLRLAQQYSLAGKKPAGCDVLVEYQFYRANPHQYQIEAVCGNGDYLVKTVDLNLLYQMHWASNIYRPAGQLIKFYVLGRGTNAHTTTSGIIRIRVRSSEETTQLRFIRVMPSGDIYVED